ncbi:hypothetical protein P3X46_017593 [Hevea brasiliensis]|uniref:Uncharacterized protein n=1 Tax=Hevea brasiliensis TaxID=3981 RepID=A0ABQ9LN40_HEVBR|nr:acylsugar acyltransferase 3-like [Hevea brasiliensis]KAJ9169391.1 hypothetical protein P3X46_017593 [Hevea brasiliensis]
MTTNMQPQIVSREKIKPSSSTPNHKTIHTLSFFDQICPRIYVPLVFFYPENDHTIAINDHNPGTDIVHKSTVLKSSLSAALSLHYPLAGRIRDDFTIDCRDDGVIFLEAKAKCELSDILNHPREETLKLLFPDGLWYKDSILSSPLVVQITYFECGGISIAVCMCHKILDMTSMCSFINDWASLARNSGQEIRPEFNIGSSYPAVNLPIMKPPRKVNCASRRLVFDASDIAKLKAIVANEVKNPTRVEVVTALLYKCAISASKASSGSLKPTVSHHAMNLRTRVFSPLSERCSGNLIGFYPVSTMEDDREIEFFWLVKRLRQEKTQFSNTCSSETLSGKELCLFILESVKWLRGNYPCNGKDQEVYLFTSWCMFPLYEADFGWGKPEWVTTLCWEEKNFIIVMDKREGDGIEAFVTLEEEAMAMFEHDKELLDFASIY